MMNLEIRYLVIPVKDREASLEFFCGKLGFQAAGSVNIRNRHCAALKINDKGPLLVLEETDIEDEKDVSLRSERIVLNTDDCLRDYYKLKSLGVTFLNKPEYLSVGLSVRFTDPSGNQFSLFEQRDYKS